jgi:hypothetical protein
VSARLRKLVALALSAWLLILGSGNAAAFSAEIEHAVEYVQLEGGNPSAEDGHGCAGHLSAHLLALSEGCEAQLSETCNTPPVPHPDLRGAYLLPDPFYSPPKLSLA